MGIIKYELIADEHEVGNCRDDAFLFVWSLVKTLSSSESFPSSGSENTDAEDKDESESIPFSSSLYKS